MIQEISYPTRVDALGFNSPKKSKANSNIMSSPIERPVPVMHYSLNNLKANYVSFTSKEQIKDLAQKLEDATLEGADILGFKKTSQTKYQPEYLSKFKERELISGDY